MINDELSPFLLVPSNFSAHFEILNKNNPRTRLLWRSDFQHFIQSKFPEWVDYFHKHSKHDNSTPILKLQKTELTDKYLVFFEDSEKPTLPDIYTHSSTDGVNSQSPIRENKISSEYTHRMQIWNHLQEHYKSTNVLPDILREEYRIYRGAAGIWYDKERTTPLSDDGNGITVSVLHTGKSYPDDVGDDSIIYHYPTTNRSGNSDQNEINATKNCKKYHLPLFIITHSKENEKLRDVQLGYVVDWNDDNRTFLINFSESEPIIEPSLPMVADTPFDWTQQRKQKTTTTTSPQRNPVFRFNVLKRYGSKCAVCSIKIDNLLSASHIIPVGEKGGSDDVRNGTRIVPQSPSCI